MIRLMHVAVAGVLIIGLAGCYNKDNYSDNGYGNAEYNAADYNAEAAAANGAYDANASGTQYASADSWPEGARIVVEDNVTYRIDPNGVRVRLGEADSRIEMINGVRYRIDPGGARVRIDDRGLAVRVPVDANASVEVNTN